eukprot:scaffold53208_cov18-Tisochrysis_lutea.AAC.2
MPRQLETFFAERPQRAGTAVHSPAIMNACFQEMLSKRKNLCPRSFVAGLMPIEFPIKKLLSLSRCEDKNAIADVHGFNGECSELCCAFAFVGVVPPNDIAFREGFVCLLNLNSRTSVLFICMMSCNRVNAVLAALIGYGGWSWRV